MTYCGKKITNETRLYCVVGYPISNSLSPIMHNEAFYIKNLDCVYLAFEIKESLGVAIQGLKVLGVSGFNVTMPHKGEIINFLDQIDENASLIGAVNTVVNRDGKLSGYNTDINGITSALKTRLKSFNGTTAVILGAGGAARACIMALYLNGCKEILILNRTVEKARHVLENLSKKLDLKIQIEKLSNQVLKKALVSADILINATPVGSFLNINESLVPKEAIKEKSVVFDVVYKPKLTKLLRDSEERGAKIVPGYLMFVGQGAKSFELWTGLKAPINSMERVVLEALN